MEQLKSFFTGIQFLTRLPTPTFQFKGEYFAQALLYFPLIGLVIALILTGADILLLNLFNPAIAGALLLFIYILITGGLHLDGLIDTIDGFFSNRSREKILEIMKDSRVGAHGVTGVVIFLLLKYSIYQSLGTVISYIALLQVFVLSRWAMVLLIQCFPYIRPEGLGKLYQEQSSAKLNKQFWGSAVLAFLLTLFLEWKIGIVLIIAITTATWIYGSKIVKIVGGLTGDTYGACTELMEVLGLIVVLLWAKVL